MAPSIGQRSCNIDPPGRPVTSWVFWACPGSNAAGSRFPLVLLAPPSLRGTRFNRSRGMRDIGVLFSIDENTQAKGASGKSRLDREISRRTHPWPSLLRHDRVRIGGIQRCVLHTEPRPTRGVMDKKDRGEIGLEEFGQAVAPFMFNDLSDAIRICVFFENYMKAILMSERIIVHQFTSERLKPLGRRQNKQPIDNLYLVKCRIEPDEVSEQTIGMGLMLNSKYQDVIKLPDDIRDIVREINTSRNSLHFRPNMAGEYGRSTVADLRKLNGFADQWVQKAVEASKADRD